MPSATAFFASFFWLATCASAEGAAYAQTEAYGARKDWTIWSAVMVGKVFCDQCLQSKVFPFAHPMSNAKVAVHCKDAQGRIVDTAQATTNFLGDFTVSFKGKQDLNGCAVSLAGSSDRRCAIAGGGGRTLRLKSHLLFKALYVVDPLFYRPATPLRFCPRRDGGVMVPFSNRRPSTCSCSDWLRPDFRCYWPKDMAPWTTTVGAVFGRGARRKYGAKMTLAGGLLAGDELLRQATAALLNARTNQHFYMSPRGVKSRFSRALASSWRAKSGQARAFRQANTKGKCLLVSCKW